MSNPQASSPRAWPGWAARAGLALAIGLAACGRAETPRITPTPFRLRLIVDASLAPLARALTDAYSVYRPNAGFAVESVNASVAVSGLSAGRADLALLGLEPEAVPGRPPPWSRELAYEGIAVIVHPQNPLTGLGVPLARDIFSGARSRWSDVGITSLGDILLGVREEGDSGRLAFDRSVMAGTRLSSNALVLASLDVALNTVAAQPLSISYAPSSRLTGTLVPRVKMVPLDGVLPTFSGVATGAYPVIRAINLVALSEPGGELRQFVAWALSEEGQRVSADLGFVPASQMQR